MSGRLTITMACLVCAVSANAGAAAPAGCDASRPAIAYAPGGAQVDVASDQQLVPCRYDTGGRAMEPSLDFTRDGRVLFQEWQLPTGHPDGAPVTPTVFPPDSSYQHWDNVGRRSGRSTASTHSSSSTTAPTGSSASTS